MSKDAGRDTLGYGPAANGRRNGDQMTDFEMGTSMRGVAVEEPLSEEELDQLSDFLKEIGPSALNLEGVDGLFCALISGPEMVLPSEYLPEIWGDDFAFDSQEDATQITGLLMRHWNTIARTLRGTLTAPDLYMPVMFEDADGVTRGNDWAEGFILGTQIRPTFWSELLDSEEHGGLLLPAMILSHEDDPNPEMRPAPIPPEKREELLLAMIASTTKIYRHFEPLRLSLPTGRQTPPRTQRRTGAKIGRNDPCPCGSGKKYKRCCSIEAPTIH